MHTISTQKSYNIEEKLSKSQNYNCKNPNIWIYLKSSKIKVCKNTLRQNITCLQLNSRKRAAHNLYMYLFIRI